MFALAGLKPHPIQTPFGRRSRVLAKAGEMRFEKSCQCRNGDRRWGVIGFHLSYVSQDERKRRKRSLVASEQKARG
jgi:hypothetical protein